MRLPERSLPPLFIPPAQLPPRPPHTSSRSRTYDSSPGTRRCQIYMEGRRRRRSPCHGSRRRRRAVEMALGRKVRELRRLVPGAAAVPAERLLIRAADYIVRLRAKVELLRTLSELIAVTDNGGMIRGGGHHHDGDGAIH